jgi:uncharacterized membrane protein YesL
MLGSDMFGFLIKKAFFDLWDNLIRIVILNLGYILLLAVLVYFPLLFKNSPPLFYAFLGLGLVLLSVYTGAASWMVAQVADYRKPELSEALKALKASWPTSLLFAGLNLLLVFLLSVAFPVYGQLKSFLGPLASSFLFWVLIFWVLASQFYFPIQSRLDRRFLKILKKSFLLFLDNPLFTFGLFLGCLLIFALSVFTAFLLPGISAVLLWLNAGLKLRLYKYDHLEKNPKERRRIPWDALLVEDRERVGKRTLKGMIFPWKE